MEILISYPPPKSGLSAPGLGSLSQTPSPRHPQTDTPASPPAVPRAFLFRTAPCLPPSKWPIGSGLPTCVYEGLDGGGGIAGGGQSLSKYLCLSAHLYSKGNLILKIELGRGDERIFRSRVEPGVRAGGGGIRGEVRTQEEGGRPSCCEEGRDGVYEGGGRRGGLGLPVPCSPFLAS